MLSKSRYTATRGVPGSVTVTSYHLPPRLRTDRNSSDGSRRIRHRQDDSHHVGDEPQTFFGSFNTLSDGSTIYQPDEEAWIYLGNTPADLNPGDSIDTAVAFDVPKGTDVESIELHDGPFSDGVTVGL